jgi:hypothetical protein
MDLGPSCPEQCDERLKARKFSTSDDISYSQFWAFELSLTVEATFRYPLSFMNLCNFYRIHLLVHAI